MSNQYTTFPYTNKEIKDILQDYQNGTSYSCIAVKFKRKKTNIKKILIENNIWVEGRNKLKKEFSDEIIEEIIKKYKGGLSCKKISEIYSMSKDLINRIIKEKNLLKEGYSNGKKILLSESQKNAIKKLYVEDLKTPPEIAKKLELNVHFVEKIIYNSNYTRTKGESISLRQTGKKRTDRVKSILKDAQQKLAKSGKRKQTGGVCKTFIIDGIKCVGTYEKFYIEKLKKENKKLPENSEPITTPYGVYYPDFTNCSSFIEIKSDYTYDILIGKKINRWTKNINTLQYNKIKWVNENVKLVDILIVDKKNNNIIKKEIL
jgi:hypothetical protein